MSILSIRNLNKSFSNKKIIDGLSFNVPDGCIYGFLGQNGAGKTTTMKMVLGLLKPDSGSIEVCGEPVTYGETKTNRHIGFLPDVPEFYGYMKPMEYLDLCGKITNLDKNIIKRKSIELLSLVGLENANKKIGGYSRGMKQRLGIAQALLNEPKLLICDEPTSALDPMGRKEILDILFSVKGKTTIVFSTHILTDVERICDHVAVLNKGTLVLDGTFSQLKQKHRQNTIIINFSSPDDASNLISKVKCLSNSIEQNKTTVSISSNNIQAVQKNIYDMISALNIYPTKVEVLEPTLENLFIEVIK